MAVVGDFVHRLGGLKSWPTLQPLDYSSFKIATASLPYAFAGRCGSLNSSNEWTAGVTATATTLPMPLFLLRSYNDFDVSTSASNSYGAAVYPTGKDGALVGTGAFELYTTEFDTTQATYVPNLPLTAPTTTKTSTGDEAAKLYNKKNWTGGGGGDLAVGTDTIVGITSFGRSNAGDPVATAANYKSPFGRNDVLAFWPSFHPGTA